jgi:hypothetical protein
MDERKEKGMKRDLEGACRERESLERGENH